MKRVRSNETGPHLLSPLEYDVYRLIEDWPKRADPERIRSSLPPASLPEVERALASLGEAGYVERIIRGGDAGSVEILRLTPWGKMIATTAKFWWRQELHDWLFKHSRGEVSDDSRPRRSLVKVNLAPWEVGPSFDELDVEALDLPTRARNALRYCGVGTVGQVVRMTAEEPGGRQERRRQYGRGQPDRAEETIFLARLATFSKIWRVPGRQQLLPAR